MTDAERFNIMVKIIKDIREMTDPDDPDSYRNDDPHGCLDSIFVMVDQIGLSA